jgi:hypothetical protein
MQPEYIYYRSEFLDNWTGDLGTVSGESLTKALDDAYNAINTSPIPVAYRQGNGLLIYGYQFLNWQQCNSLDWQSDLP